MKLLARLVLAIALLLPATACADLIPTSLQPADEAPTSSRADLQGRLQGLGLSPTQAAERVAQLSPNEIAALAADPAQVELGGHEILGLGSSATTTALLIVGGVFLTLIILNAIFHFV